MIRIKFEFEHVSPFLRVCAGVFYVEEVDSVHISNAPIELFRCRFKKEQNSMGFSSIDHEIDGGIPTKLFECLRPILDAKIRSYWHGMVLQKDDYQWVPMDGDESWKKVMSLEKEVKLYIERRKAGDTEQDVLTELKEGSA